MVGMTTIDPRPAAPAASRTRDTYRLINSDGHVNEPGDLWTTRVPAHLRDRVPRIERFAEGDAWVIEGVRDPINFGWNSCAGMKPEEMTGWIRFEDLRPGNYDPAARLVEMDEDGVDAEILYPGPRLSQSVYAFPDPELHLACVRAYNDWLSEFCEHAPQRLVGAMLLPNCGVDAALAEIDRVLGRPGMTTVTLGRYPNGTLEPSPDDDRVWATLVERGTTLNVHVAFASGLPSAHRSALPGYGRFFDAPNRIVQMIFAGIFDRFPSLPVVFAEVDFGWVPYFKEQIDNNYHRLRGASDFTIRDLPSRYVERNIHFTYMTDTFGLQHLDHVGAERVMWCSDYPHISADWPYSWRTIQASTAGLSSRDRSLVLHENAQRLYGLGG
jgi:predicted TIM-barrel fold metal-dependent hydrolase